jgi:predicted nucleotidyltransferase
MRPENILQDFLADVAAVQGNQQECEIYIFGSILRNSPLVSDLDLLILYRHADDLEQLKQRLHPVCAKYPVDLVCMTPAEEAQFDFIAGQQATPVHELIA